jgi:predicted phage-related endonuclease
MTLNLGLTPQQLAARKFGIGSSDARVVAEGTDEERYQLWLEKTGKVEPKPILKPWDAALRHHCEHLILDWYAEITQRPLTRRGESVICADHPVLRCTLDGFDAQKDKPIDAKMLNLFTPDAFEWCRSHYTWQIFHQILCCGVGDGALYVSVGMKEPVAIEIEYDEFTAMQYVDRAKEFWSYVESGKEPPGAPAPMAAPLPIESMRTVDFSLNNRWGALAADWLGNRDAAKKFDEAQKGLKSMVEPDVREASGFGVYIKRDKRGLRITGDE